MSFNHEIEKMDSLAQRPSHRFCRQPGGKCGGRANWLARYQYVTGRAGRTTWREVPLCDFHAARFRSKYIVLDADQVENPADE